MMQGHPRNERPIQNCQLTILGTDTTTQFETRSA
ncbi:hypothetical protein GGQ68_002235 [Sagittula marina]|uniref:Uncharacterized protein n=1 Tax=Sagittula marina TaxID=943940 RepID=A0A7W6DNA9_9RHOB|nr:hypothetical protein [Sagittula marina]